MKRNHLIALTLLLGVTAIALSSCKKDPEAVAELISKAEAGEIVEILVSEKTAGMTAPTIDMTEILQTVLNSCGQPGDTSYQITKELGPATYSRSFNMSWLVNCSPLSIPTNAAFDVNGAGSFNYQTWNGTTTATGNITFTGLALTAQEYIGNGSYQYSGALTGSTRRSNPTFDCDVTLNLADLTISKSTSAITGGNGTVIVKASTTGGENITLNGTLVFNGNGTATVTFNGNSHTFQLS